MLGVSPLSDLPLGAEPAAAQGGFRSFVGFWVGGLAALSGGAVGNPWHYYAQMRRMST